MKKKTTATFNPTEIPKKRQEWTLNRMDFWRSWIGNSHHFEVEGVDFAGVFFVGCFYLTSHISAVLFFRGRSQKPEKYKARCLQDGPKVTNYEYRGQLANNSTYKAIYRGPMTPFITCGGPSCTILFTFLLLLREPHHTHGGKNSPRHPQKKR